MSPFRSQFLRSCCSDAIGTSGDEDDLLLPVERIGDAVIQCPITQAAVESVRNIWKTQPIDKLPGRYWKLLCIMLEHGGQFRCHDLYVLHLEGNCVDTDEAPEYRPNLVGLHLECFPLYYVANSKFLLVSE